MNCCEGCRFEMQGRSDRYKIIDTGVAGKSRCVAGIGHIA